MSIGKQEAIKVFVSYSHEDEYLGEQLRLHLAFLLREGIISTWHDREITAGIEWTGEINRNLDQANIILLLISADFLASDYCWDIEMQRALERHEAGQARVIPIILRPVDWQEAPFGKLQALPRNGKPITTWDNADEAFLDVAQGIRRVIEELTVKSKTEAEYPIVTRTGKPTYKLGDVFKKSGVPEVTFVEPDDFNRLKLALDQPGRGVIIEGPSGVGKSTSLYKALEQIRSFNISSKFLSSLEILSVRNPEHLSKIKNLQSWHQGIVVIDDIHRLQSNIYRKIVDYLKYLADIESEFKKLVLIGIPQSGQSLVNISFDIATRIDIFRMGRVSNDAISNLLEKGEEALNIKFIRKSDIIRAAGGSLNIAQFLCYEICSAVNIIETQNLTQRIECDIEAAASKVMEYLKLKFYESIRSFASLGGHRDQTCIRILQALSHSDDGFLSLPHLKDKQPELRKGIEQLINNKWMQDLYVHHHECEHFIYYDEPNCALIADDPQLIFYLLRLSTEQLRREVGKSATASRNRIFISYSHRDSEWIKRLQVHLAPLVRQGLIDRWDDTRIQPGRKWRNEIEDAIDSARVAIMLVSADFLASDFIMEEELPKLLKKAEDEGTIILSVIVGACAFETSDLYEFQAVNPPSKPIEGLTPAEQNQVWATVARTIGNIIN